MHGAPGSGKTSITDLALGNPPAEERHSTLVATSPARAIAGSRIAASGEGCEVVWTRTGAEELMQLLAESIVYVNEDMPPATLPSAVDRDPDSRTPPTASKVTFLKRLMKAIRPKRFLGASSSASSSKHGTTAQSLGDDHVQGSEHSSQKSHRQWSATAKHLLSLLRSATKSNRLYTAHWIYLIDSGGQPQFLEVLPLFICHNSVNAITIRLCEKLSDKPPFEFVIHGKHTCQPRELQLSNQQLIESLFRSLSSVQPQHVQQAKSSPSEPHFMIIGTFLDKAGECQETLEEKNQVLFEALAQYQNVRIDSDPANGKIIFPLNAVCTEGREELASQLRQLIAGRPETRLIMDVPMRWFAFELEVSRTAEEKEHYVLTLHECEAAGKVLEISAGEVVQALIYFTALSMFLYIPECLPDTVLVSLQPVLNKLSVIIALTFGETASLLGVLPLPPGALLQLRNEGIFTMDVLRCFPDGFISGIFTEEHFVRLLSYLLVTAPVLHKGLVREYFLPCVLQRGTLEEDEKSPFLCNAEPWIITWDLKPIPVGLFTALVVSLLNRDKSPRFSLIRSTQQLRNAIRLSCKDGGGGAVLLVDQHYWLEVCYSGAATDCPSIRQAVLAGISLAGQRLHYAASLKVGFPCFLCRDSSEHICLVHCRDDPQHPLQCTTSGNCHICASPNEHYRVTCCQDETTTAAVTGVRHLAWLPNTLQGISNNANKIIGAEPSLTMMCIQ